MEIICPECQFSREVDETKIPARSQVATCPKCQAKFKFRELPDTLPAAPSPTPESVIEEKSAAPEPVEEKSAPSGPRQASLLDHAPIPVKREKREDPTPTFPKLHAPGEDSGEALWDKLNGMTPPEKNEKPTPPESQATGTGDDEQQAVPDWTGEFNEDFPDPMGFEAVPEPEETSPQVPPPFEQLDRYGFFHGLFLTIKLALISPRLFFSVMPVGGGLTKPLTFTILVAMIQAFSQLAWGAVGLTIGIGLNGQQLTGVPFDVTNGILEMLLTPARVAVTLFLFAGIFHLLLIILKADNKGFEGSFRAVAYSYIPIIIGLFPMPSIPIVLGWVFLCVLWTTVLTAIGLKNIHAISYAKVIPAMLIPALLGMIAILAMAQSQIATI